MSLQDILKKILEKAQQEAKAIEAETADKKKAIEQQYKSKEKEAHQALEVKTNEALESIDRKTQSMARREASKLTGAAKKDLIDSVLATFIDHLSQLDDKTYKQIVSKLLEQITEQDGALQVSKGKKSLFDTQFEIKESEDVKGGFIFSNKQVEIDNTFESLVLSQFRPQLEIYFSEQLKLV